MKKKLLLKLAIISTLLMFISPSLFAQDGATTYQDISMGTPPVKLIKAVKEDGTQGTVSLQLTTDVAGDSISGGTAKSYLFLSSIVADQATNIVQAKVQNVPAGTQLFLTTETPTSGKGDGGFGTGTSNVTLSGTDQTIISDITSCYTGFSAQDGYVLHWRLSAGTGTASYADIITTTDNVARVTFTISAGQ